LARVAKGLEIFLRELIAKAAEAAKGLGAGKLTGYHLKRAIEAEDKYAFLKKLVEGIAGPDEEKAKKKRAKLSIS
jgi:hypothetical protein